MKHPVYYTTHYTSSKYCNYSHDTNDNRKVAAVIYHGALQYIHSFNITTLDFYFRYVSLKSLVLQILIPPLNYTLYIFPRRKRCSPAPCNITPFHQKVNLCRFNDYPLSARITSASFLHLQPFPLLLRNIHRIAVSSLGASIMKHRTTALPYGYGYEI
jgi:hypothetical protein